MKKSWLFVLVIIYSCSSPTHNNTPAAISEQYITVLGIAQDAGYPQIGCRKECCTQFYKGKQKKQRVVSLGLVDKAAKQKWLFEATPDIATQLADMEQHHLKTTLLIDGIFLTHAHIGHYTGLMYFGREALGKQGTQVYTMPKMNHFLQNNGPWSQLVSLRNIVLNELQNDSTVVLNNSLKVTPFLVPHRDEFSETVGYRIEGEYKTALFIPDIDKWQRWQKDIVAEVEKSDYAFLDATFFKDGEINRPMAEIPHPFIEETVALFSNTPASTKQKIIFIHFNHSNPALQPDAAEKKALEQQGFRFAEDGQVFGL